MGPPSETELKNKGDDEMATRELREETEKEPKLPTQKLVKTDKGDMGIVSQDVFDIGSLSNFKPYNEEEKLPAPVITTNRKGVRVLKKPGEPRFFFNGNEFIRIYSGLGGKKTSLFWTYKPNNKLHQKIRAYFKKIKFPGA